jgi:hypothetical protein
MTLYICQCTTATDWLMNNHVNDGIGMTLLIIHIIVYGAFAYLSMRKAFDTLRNVGLFKCCGCHPPVVKFKTQQDIDGNGHVDSDGSSIASPSSSRPSTAATRHASPSVAMTLIPDGMRDENE